VAAASRSRLQRKAQGTAERGQIDPTDVAVSRAKSFDDGVSVLVLAWGDDQDHDYIATSN